MTDASTPLPGPAPTYDYFNPDGSVVEGFLTHGDVYGLEVHQKYRQWSDAYLMHVFETHPELRDQLIDKETGGIKFAPKLEPEQKNERHIRPEEPAPTAKRLALGRSADGTDDEEEGAGAL